MKKTDKILTFNPFDGSFLKEYTKHTETEANRIASQASERSMEWNRRPFTERALIFHKAAKLLLERKNEYAELITLEMGKPITQAVAEVEKCSTVCDYYADNAEMFLADREIATEARKSFVTYSPLGVIFGIMPWNFPFWQVFRFLVPTLMSGNAALLKHSSNTTGCGIEIERLLLDAGLPENLMKTLVLAGSEAEDFIGNIHIAAVSLTGSTYVGQRVTAKAGQYLKKCVMELGGSDPYLVLNSANVKKAASVCAAARMVNSGQSCIAAKRFIVEAKVYDEFLYEFIEQMKTYHMGDPLLPETKLGPQSRSDLRDELHAQLTKTLDYGGKLLLGGNLPDGNGYFYPATVVSEVQPGMPIFDEETFGPIAAVTKAETEDLAVSLCNFTQYGLGAAIFTEDLEKAEYLAKHKIDAGSVFVNSGVRSDVRLPFGGIKESGYGRELSEEGIREFVNIKSVVIE